MTKYIRKVLMGVVLAGTPNTSAGGYYSPVGFEVHSIGRLIRCIYIMEYILGRNRSVYTCGVG